MEVTFIPKRVRRTFAERVQAAVAAFRTKDQHNPAYSEFRDRIKQERFERALATIPEHDHEVILKGGFYAPTFVFAAIEQAPRTDDQIELMKHVVKTNPRILLDERAQSWASRNSEAVAEYFVRDRENEL